MIVLDGKRIIRIESTGLMYLDEAGVEQFVNFETSYQNLEEYKLSPEQMKKRGVSDSDWDNYIEQVKTTREVGRRDVTADGGPYIEFYAQPVVRFKFATKEEYQETRRQFEKHGWRTFDMS